MKEKFFVSNVLQVSSHIFFIVSSYLLAVIIDVEYLGLWALINSIINISFVFIEMGIDFIHYQYSGEKNFDTYFGTFFLIKLFLILINIVLTLILFFLFQILNTKFIIYLLILLFSKIIFSITSIFLVNMRATIKIFKVEIPAFLISIGNSLSILYLCINIKNFSDPLLFLSISNLIFNILFIIFILILSSKDIKFSKPKKALTFKYLTDAKPLMLSSILGIFIINFGNILLDYYFGHKTLAYFILVNNYIIQVFVLISGSFITLYLTLYSQYFERKQIESIKKLTYITEKYSSIFFLTIILLVFLIGDLMFQIFLPKYLNSLPILYILIFYPYFLGITRPYALQMIPGRKQKIIARASVFSHCLTLLLLLVLVPKKLFFFNMLGFGAIGYALAILIPEIINTFLCRYFSKKYFNINSQKNILLHIVIAIISILIIFLIKNLILEILISNLFLLLLLSSFFGIGLFFGFLFIFKQLNHEDIIFIVELLKLRTYKKSIREEFYKI